MRTIWVVSVAAVVAPCKEALLWNGSLFIGTAPYLSERLLIYRNASLFIGTTPYLSERLLIYRNDSLFIGTTPRWNGAEFSDGARRLSDGAPRFCGGV